VCSCKHSGGCSCFPWCLFFRVWTNIELPTVLDWARTNFPNLVLRTVDHNNFNLAVVFGYEKSPHAWRGHIPQGSLGTCFLRFITHVCTRSVLLSSEGTVARCNVSTQLHTAQCGTLAQHGITACLVTIAFLSNPFLLLELGTLSSNTCTVLLSQSHDSIVFATRYCMSLHFAKTVLAFWIIIGCRTRGLTNHAIWADAAGRSAAIRLVARTPIQPRLMLYLPNLLLHADSASWCLLLSCGAGALHH